MEIDTVSPAADPVANAFKARKNRPTRHLRNRDDEDGSATPEIRNSDAPQTSEGLSTEVAMKPQNGDAMEDDGEESLSVGEILRLRNKIKPKKRGLDFTVDKRAKTPTAEEEEAIAEKDAMEKEVNAVVNRFTGQTGAIVDVNEHM
ncbi:hypothetical protein ABW20_dc0102602 [Dactylellina cionopaga]|nr:hypothetical protein ABW20_dc0102602 [Dactylellina cionopaga]